MAGRLTSLAVRTNITTESDVGPRRSFTKTYKEQAADQFARSSAYRAGYVELPQARQHLAVTVSLLRFATVF
jgi:hypothetical protein